MGNHKGMRCISILPGCAILFALACTSKVPQISEGELAEIKASNPGMTDSCLDKLRWAGFGAMPRTADQCYEMGPRQRYSGLWRREFENSRFCAAPASTCREDTSAASIWLEFSDGAGRKAPDHSDGLYDIDFVGRQTAMKGRHGHLGMFDHEIVVERLTKIEKRKEPPPG